MNVDFVGGVARYPRTSRAEVSRSWATNFAYQGCATASLQVNLFSTSTARKSLSMITLIREGIFPARLPTAYEVSDKVFGRIGYIIPVRAVEFKFSFEDLSEKVCVVFVIEWRIATEEDVRNDTDRPHVYRLAVRLLGQHLSREIH